MLRLLAPMLPYVTEEVWSWTHDGSVHRAAWPSVTELPEGGDPAVLSAVADALAAVRKVKSEAKVGMRAEVKALTLSLPEAHRELVALGEDDLRAAGRITGELTFATGEGTETVGRDADLIPVEKTPRPTA